MNAARVLPTDNGVLDDAVWSASVFFCPGVVTPMWTIANSFLFDVPKIDRLEGTPCTLLPCPFCRGLHKLPAGTPRIIKAPCPPLGPAFEGRPRPDFFALISGGKAWRELMLIFEAGDDMASNVLLLDLLQPAALWKEFQTVPYDPLTSDDPFAGDLGAMGDAFEDDFRAQEARSKKLGRGD